jgi:filamentous hemagglutinin family protein
MSGSWHLGIVSGLGISGVVFAPFTHSALAQLVPDRTLGTQSPVVTSLDELTDRIDGGARRGANLFQSFLEFNVGQGRGVYFANPTGIEHILTRVTGDNPSNILGKLGVLGNANLFLLNPNGIVFGPNATLDIKGSFLATTANAIQLGEYGYFNASQPEKSRLISVRPGALFFNQVADQSSAIANSGKLAVGQNLTLSAGNLDLQGQLWAGGDLKLQALDTVKVRDRATSPFIASAVGELLVQGDQAVDIFTLNHPASRFFSRGDMILRSPSPVIGDARYISRGNFRIEQSAGSLGNWLSLSDPIIRASGDVSFTSYTGASLHILAGGAVNIDSVNITGRDTTSSINQTVTLSDGTPLAIDGSARPTLDIRAGTTALADPFGVQGSPTPTGLSLTGTPTSADITIGSITVSSPNGLVLLTNQYSPNTSSSGGAIQVGAINLGTSFGNSGDLAIDSRGSIALSDTVNASSLLGNGGDITLLAAGNLTTSDINSLGLLGGNITLTSNGTISLNNHFILSGTSIPVTSSGLKGGDINVNARALSLTNGARMIAASVGTAQGGHLNVRASESIELSGTDSGLLDDVLTIPQIASFLPALPVDASEALERIQGSGLLSATVGNGAGGDVRIETGRLNLRDGSEISAYAFNQGHGGNLTVNASESVELIGTTPTNFIGGLFALTYAGGDAGDVAINTPSLIARNGSSVSASSLGGTGNGGELTVNASELVELSGTSRDGEYPSNLSAVSIGEMGNSRNLTVNTQRLIVRDGAALATTTNGEGRGGDLTVNASESVELSGVSAVGLNPTILSTDTFSQNPNAGKAGDLTINTPTLMVRDGAVVSASTWGPGQGGRLEINASESVDLNGTSNKGSPSGLYAQVFGSGNAGNLRVSTPTLSVRNGARVTVASADATTDFRFASGSVIVGLVQLTFPDRATGDAGEMTIQADSIQLDNQGSLTASSVRAGGGNITIDARDIRLRNSSPISTSVANSNGGGGDIKINSDNFIALEDSDILANADEGPGGNITINSPVFLADLFSSGQATAVGRNPGDFAQFRGNGRVDISAKSRVGISGTETFPDFSFLQNSLSALSENFVNPEQAIANSCLARRNAEQGSFTVTGTNGLPDNPYESVRGRYEITEVQSLSPREKQPVSSSIPNSQSSSTANRWKLGDSVQEAQGMTVTSQGRILLGTTGQLVAAKADELVCHQSEQSSAAEP